MWVLFYYEFIDIIGNQLENLTFRMQNGCANIHSVAAPPSAICEALAVHPVSALPPASCETGCSLCCCPSPCQL